MSRGKQPRKERLDLECCRCTSVVFLNRILLAEADKDLDLFLATPEYLGRS